MTKIARDGGRHLLASIIGALIIGLIIGAVARALMPGSDAMGLFVQFCTATVQFYPKLISDHSVEQI